MVLFSLLFKQNKMIESISQIFQTLQKSLNQILKFDKQDIQSQK